MMFKVARKAPVPLHSRTTSEPDITWKALKRSRNLELDPSEAGITLEMITGAVQPSTNDSTRLELYYSCQHCNFCSYYTSKFKDHISSRSPGTLFQCHLCTFKCCTSSGLRIHKEAMHSTNIQVIPSLQPGVQIIAAIAKAPKVETPPISVQKSYLSAPKAKSGYQCTHCQKKFWKKILFQRHIRTHTQERPFKCDHCNLSFNNEAKMNRHIFVRSGSVYKCNFCELKFCFGISLTKHVKTSHGNYISDAPALPVMFNHGEEDKSIVGHPMSDQPLDETLICDSIPAKLPGMSCLHCDLTFSNQELFLQHTKDCSGDSSRSNNCNTSIWLEAIPTSLEEISNNAGIEGFVRIPNICNKDFNPLQNDSEEDWSNPKIKEVKGIQNICTKDIKKRGSLKVRLRSGTDNRQFQCDRCSYISSKVAKIKKHKQSRGRKSGQLYNCDKCAFKSCTSQYLRIHWTETHLEEDPSSVLEHLDEANCTSPLMMPVQTRMEEDNLSQEHLDQSKPPLSKANEEIPRALVTRPEIKKSWVICPLCSKKFGGSHKKRRLEDHIRVHTGEKPFKCNECPYTCAHYSALCKHRRRHHVTSSSSSSISPKCNESIYKRSNYSGFTSCSSDALQKDVQAHSAHVPPEDNYPGNGNMKERNVPGKTEKPYKCTYCEYRSKYPYATRTHERMHTGGEPFQCNICGKEYSYRSSLSKHKRKHLQNQTFGVNVNTLPGRTFNFKGRIFRNPVNTQVNPGEGTRNAVEGKLVTVQPKLHVPPKTFKCELCSYKSKFPSNVVSHSRVHSGEKPFKCQYCPYRSAWKHDWKKHEVRHVSRGREREILESTPQPQFKQMGSPVIPKVVDHQTVANKKHFKYRLCNYRPDRSGQIKNHARTHATAKKSFECKTCGFRFTCRSHLSIHRDTHYV